MYSFKIKPVGHLRTRSGARAGEFEIEILSCRNKNKNKRSNYGLNFTCVDQLPGQIQSTSLCCDCDDFLISYLCPRAEMEVSAGNGSPCCQHLIVIVVHLDKKQQRLSLLN